MCPYTGTSAKQAVSCFCWVSKTNEFSAFSGKWIPSLPAPPSVCERMHSVHTPVKDTDSCKLSIVCQCCARSSRCLCVYVFDPGGGLLSDLTPPQKSKMRCKKNNFQLSQRQPMLTSLPARLWCAEVESGSQFWDRSHFLSGLLYLFCLPDKKWHVPPEIMALQ